MCVGVNVAPEIFDRSGGWMGVKHCPRGVRGSLMGISALGPGVPEELTEAFLQPLPTLYLGPG